MKTITIRDLRQRWPEAESALEVKHEIVITRHSKPIAKLVRLPKTEKKRNRWDPEKHKKWMKKMFGNRQVSWVDKYLITERRLR